jgi:hypothetical protein
MTSPFSNGVITQQDIRDRNIARQRIAEAIAREERRVDFLVDCTVELVRNRQAILTNLERVWDSIQSDLHLHEIRQVADNNVADYAGFSGWLNGSRLNIETRGRMRLASELNEALLQQRFANTTGFRPALAA